MQIPQGVGEASTFQTTDVEALEAFHVGKNRRYLQLRSGRFSGEIDNVQLGKIQVFREHLNVGMRLSAAPPQQMLPFGLVYTDGAGISYCGRTPGETSLFQATGGEWEICFSDRLHYVGFVIDREFFARALLAIDASEIPADWMISRTRGSDPVALRRLESALWSVLDLDRNGCLPSANSVAGRLLQAGITSAAIATLGSSQAPSRLRETMQARRRGVQRVVEFLAEHAWEVPTMIDLCAIAGVSERSLQMGFKERFNLTPVEYLRLARLDGAMRELKIADPRCTTVSDVATRWGFHEFGRFSGHYRAMFHELPSQTLQRV